MSYGRSVRSTMQELSLDAMKMADTFTDIQYGYSYSAGFSVMAVGAVGYIRALPNGNADICCASS